MGNDREDTRAETSRTRRVKQRENILERERFGGKKSRGLRREIWRTPRT